METVLFSPPPAANISSFYDTQNADNFH